jgi:hypothetical protein
MVDVDVVFTDTGPGPLPPPPPQATRRAATVITKKYGGIIFFTDKLHPSLMISVNIF